MTIRYDTRLSCIRSLPCNVFKTNNCFFSIFMHSFIIMWIRQIKIFLNLSRIIIPNKNIISYCDQSNILHWYLFYHLAKKKYMMIKCVSSGQQMPICILKIILFHVQNNIVTLVKYVRLFSTWTPSITQCVTYRSKCNDVYVSWPFWLFGQDEWNRIWKKSLSNWISIQ